jgi:hypothetical protein
MLWKGKYYHEEKGEVRAGGQSQAGQAQHRRHKRERILCERRGQHVYLTIKQEKGLGGANKQPMNEGKGQGKRREGSTSMNEKK